MLPRNLRDEKIVFKIKFYYCANLSLLINFYSPYRFLMISGGIEVKYAYIRLILEGKFDEDP